MKSIESLKKLYQTSLSIPKIQFLLAESESKIQKLTERIENIFVVPILDMLFNYEHKKLVALLSKNKIGKYLAQFCEIRRNALCGRDRF